MHVRLHRRSLVVRSQVFVYILIPLYMYYNVHVCANSDGEDVTAQMRSLNFAIAGRRSGFYVSWLIDIYSYLK